MYVLSWRTISALTRVLFLFLFKHQNNPLVSAETVRHSSTYIIIYLLKQWSWYIERQARMGVISCGVGWFWAILLKEINQSMIQFRARRMYL